MILKARILLKIFFVVISLLTHSSPLLASFSSQQRPHHFFNAHLLQPNEQQLSIFGNYKFGFLPTLELGVQGLLLLGGLPNIYLKHQMFQEGNIKTSFVAHSVASGSVFFSAHGIISTITFENSHELSLGLLDFYFKEGNIFVDNHSTLHFFSPSIAYDKILSEHFAFGVAAVHPKFILAHIQNDLVDLDATITIPFDQSIYTVFTTLTYSGESFNAEFGFVAAGSFDTNSGLSPYLNLFWRFL